MRVKNGAEALSRKMTLLKFEAETFDLFDMSRFAMVSTGWNTSSSATPVCAENGNDVASAASSLSRDGKKLHTRGTRTENTGCARLSALS
jgi:hypothetical protein